MLGFVDCRQLNSNVGDYSFGEMIPLSNGRLACLMFALAFVAGCHAKPARNAPGSSPTANTRQPAPLTPVAQEVERRGYHAKESLIVAPSAWEVSTFRMRNKKAFSFRANQPEPGSTNYFCRFMLFEETYDTLDDARHRLANVHLSAPDADGMEQDYL